MEGEKPGLVRVYPKSNCPRCYGRGYIGHDPHGGRVECSCLVRKKAHIPLECQLCGKRVSPDNMEIEEGDLWICERCFSKGGCDGRG